jgi:acyl carrier protein
MNIEKILEGMQEIFRDIFDDAALIINRETSSEDIEDWDSLAQINLVVSMEKEFKVKFTLLELANLHNVGDMADLIENKLQK